MPKNPFFSYLDQQHARLKRPVAHYVQKTDSQGNKFCCLELAINPGTHFVVNNQPVRLQEAHFTIYEHQRAAFGSYHFTVTIIDQQGASQKVRIYFDEDGKILRKPHFLTHDLAVDGPEELADDEQHHDLNEGLLGLSIRLSETVIQPYIQAMFKHINHLEEQYRAADSNANKADLAWSQQPTEENRVAYNQALTKMMETLESLLFLTDDNLHRGRLRFVNARLDYLNKPAVTQTPAQPLPDVASSTTETSEISSTTATIVKTLVAMPLSLDTDIQSIQEKLSQFSSTTHADHAARVAQFASLAQAFFDLQLCVGEKGYTIGVDALQVMSKLEKSIFKIGKTLAKQLALAKESSLLEGLPIAFHSALSDSDLLNTVLESEEDEVLACLLRYSQCPIATQAVRVAGKPYLSAVHYCLEAAKNSNLITTITTLRPLSWWANESLLLAAHRVLSNKQSTLPLEHILTQTMQPYQLVQFYNRLIKALETHLQNNVIIEKDQRLLRMQLQDYRKKLICARYADPLTRNADLFDPVALQASEEKALATTPSTLSDYLAKLRQDSDVLAKKKELAGVMRTLTRQGAVALSSRDREEQNRARLSFQAQLNGALSGFLGHTDQIVKLYANVPSLDEYQPPAYDELKSRLLTFMGDLSGHMHDMAALTAEMIPYTKKTQKPSRAEMDAIDETLDSLRSKIDAFQRAYGFTQALTEKETKEEKKYKARRAVQKNLQGMKEDVNFMQMTLQMTMEELRKAQEGEVNMRALAGLAAAMQSGCAGLPVGAAAGEDEPSTAAAAAAAAASARPPIERPKP
jgi:hypothetical protein